MEEPGFESEEGMKKAKIPIWIVRLNLKVRTKKQAQIVKTRLLGEYQKLVGEWTKLPKDWGTLELTSEIEDWVKKFEDLMRTNP